LGVGLDPEQGHGRGGGSLALHEEPGRSGHGKGKRKRRSQPAPPSWVVGTGGTAGGGVSPEGGGRREKGGGPEERGRAAEDGGQGGGSPWSYGRALPPGSSAPPPRSPAWSLASSLRISAASRLAAFCPAPPPPRLPSPCLRTPLSFSALPGSMISLTWGSSIFSDMEQHPASVP
jgi:hypothetical protein